MSEEKRTWLSGSFLISDVNLADPHFHRTVILIISHDENGAFGLVVNRRIDATLADVVPDFEKTEAASIPLFEGGPVDRQYLFAIHSGFPENVRSDHAEEPVAHVTFEPALHEIEPYLRKQWADLPSERRPPIRVYSGYSGWSAGQLESELAEESWIVRPASAKHIFADDPDEGWRHALGELGGIHKIVAETGYKPLMN